MPVFVRQNISKPTKKKKHFKNDEEKKNISKTTKKKHFKNDEEKTLHF
jgi:hypothetical protein